MAMTVGVARLALYLEDTFSLKDKRQTVRSITTKVRNQFNAGIAEVAVDSQGEARHRVGGRPDLDVGANQAVVVVPAHRA